MMWKLVSVMTFRLFADCRGRPLGVQARLPRVGRPKKRKVMTDRGFLHLQLPKSLQDDARGENIRKNLGLPPLRQDNVERHPVSAVPLERLGDDGVA